ncbi:hypothetical protein A4X06_0g565 [Tilletia controversa]|uniref:Hydrophobic surface binding protein n=2 Tax=Tilletia TaxID=13289 RepID=A0A8X7T015_9BASI|nr:hypothetical protein CF336_g535 [Tilletia laevis]KAE8205196.1 hypothetical protein CF328_g626 [Tilletia controversa]KAE8208257.1 hypothetical protein CF335_g552 [Tilletia laevis]KAE8255146.1 hypothetical protein A4X06_0g565 [Tilletia controversa]KAE8264989.1 hypothetical protein A4X03_0g560 [Tilletia caries]
MKFSIVIIAAALIAGVAADYAKVHDDVVNIKISVQKLAKMLKTAEGAKLGESLGVHFAAQDLNKAIGDANEEAKATPSVTEPQAKTILSILTSAYPYVVNATDQLVVIEPNFKKIGVVDIAKKDISDIAESTKTFTVSLVEKAPASLKESAKALADKYNKTLASAVAHYSD